jgi:hypothetical protein
LTVNDLAREWGVSATPLREALARLAGEGLVEDRRGRGYFAWRLDVSDLIDLYRAQETLTLTALTGLVRRPVQASPPVARPVVRTASGTPAAFPEGESVNGLLFWEALTWRIAQEAGQRFLLGAQQRLADRLAPARQVEPVVLSEDVGALNDLADAVNRRAWRTVCVDIHPYFTRRSVAAALIVDKLRSSSDIYIQSIECL